MRGKLAKELRVIAREMCEFDNAVDVSYVGGTPPEFEQIGKITVKTKKGIPRRLSNKCVRFLYRYMKRKA